MQEFDAPSTIGLKSMCMPNCDVNCKIRKEIRKKSIYAITSERELDHINRRYGRYALLVFKKQMECICAQTRLWCSWEWFGSTHRWSFHERMKANVTSHEWLYGSLLIQNNGSVIYTVGLKTSWDLARVWFVSQALKQEVTEDWIIQGDRGAAWFATIR